MTEKVIVTMWIKDNTINAAFSDNGKLYSKICQTRQEAEKEFDIMKKMLSELGNEIKIKEIK